MGTRYPPRSILGRGLSSTEAVARFRQELMLETGRDFIPYTYHLPVAVVIAKVRADFSLIEIVSLDSPEYRPAVILNISGRLGNVWQADFRHLQWSIV